MMPSHREFDGHPVAAGIDRPRAALGVRPSRAAVPGRRIHGAAVERLNDSTARRRDERRAAICGGGTGPEAEEVALE
jgi:hypothetical protein